MNKLNAVTYLFVLCMGLLYAGASHASYLAHQVVEHEVRIQGEVEGSCRNITLRMHHNHAIEVVYDNSFHSPLPSFSIVQNQLKPPVVNDNAASLSIRAGNLTAVLDKTTMTLRFYRDQQLLIAEEQGFFADESHLGFRFLLDKNEQLMGGGERVLGMNRRGHILPLYNKAHYGYTTESSQMYYGLPALMSDKKYMIIFDNTARGQMDIGATQSNILSFSAVSGRSAYLIVAGESYPALINNFVELTGKQPLPPRWALGNFASRFGYHNEQEVRQTVQAFKDDDIPLDAIVLDLFWFGQSIKGTMGNLAWDKTSFPQPEAMIADLHNEGVKTVVITEPFILTTSNNWDAAVQASALAMKGEMLSETPLSLNETDSELFKESPYTFDFYFGNTGLVDVFNQEGRKWFSQVYKSLHAQGVRGWWGDLGEPEVHPADIIHRFDDGQRAFGDTIHNVYGHQWADMVFNQQQAIAPNSRAMIMMRSGFIGSQRYGMIPWTGDVSRSWGGLKPQVELSLQMGLFGLAYTHSDLGGFAGGTVFDAQLYTRWLQYGVFQPVYRPHAQENIAPEPVFHDETTKNIVRDFIKLRYQLLPYNYTLAYENSTTGMPLMRPLFFENDLDPSLIHEKNTFLWGDAFLVTPVTEPDVKHVSVKVPEGVWFDWWNDDKIQGGKRLDYPVSLETLPVLVRAGSFIPMIASISSTDKYSSQHLSIHYYHDDSVHSSAGQMYEDDGTSADAIEQQAYDLLKFTGKYRAESERPELTITLAKQGNSYLGAPQTRTVNLHIHHWPHPQHQITLNGQIIPMVESKQAMMLATQAATFDAAQGLLTLKFQWENQSEQLVISARK